MPTQLERMRLAGPMIVLMIALTWHGISMFHGVDASMDPRRSMSQDHEAASIVITIACVGLVAMGMGVILARTTRRFSLPRTAPVAPCMPTRPLLARPLPGRHPPEEGVLLRH